MTRFGISEDYAEDMAYKITVVRYAMSENSYQKYIATTIASDVSEESVAYVSENTSKLQGVKSLTIRSVNTMMLNILHRLSATLEKFLPKSTRVYLRITTTIL